MVSYLVSIHTNTIQYNVQYMITCNATWWRWGSWFVVMAPRWHQKLRMVILDRPNVAVWPFGRLRLYPVKAAKCPEVLYCWYELPGYMMIHWLFRRRRGLEEKEILRVDQNSSLLTAGSPDKRSQKVKKEKHLKPKYHKMMFLLNWCEN